MATTPKSFRMGVRDEKDWKRWYWGKAYPTMEKCLMAAAPYIAANPHKVYTFHVS